MTKDELRAQRRNAYDYEGAGLEALIVALWEAVMENRPAAAAKLQAVREKVKRNIPVEDGE